MSHHTTHSSHSTKAVSPITPPPSPPHAQSHLEHVSPRAHYTKCRPISTLGPLPENPASPDRPHRGSHRPILEEAQQAPIHEVLPLSPMSPTMDPTSTRAPPGPAAPHVDQSTWIQTGAHERDQDPAQHLQAPSPLHQPGRLHPRGHHGGGAEHWASEGPHDVRRSPIPEEMEPQEPPERHPLHHEGSQDTIRANSGPRPPLDHHHPQAPPEFYRPRLLHEDSGETIRRVASREHHGHGHDAKEPIGKSARDAHDAVHDEEHDESREPVTHRTHSPAHHHQHQHQRRKRAYSQPKPLKPPRRPSAGMAIAPDDGAEMRARALNVPQVVQHLCDVQAADVALVNSIAALDGKVDRLLRHFGIEVGAVGIHGKLDALMAAVGAEEKRE